ncbi:MAG: osmoprotectant transport system permease protein [Actinomycetota bacterium]|nr:osmoprotectant transport system permease protein [Actinomycetota bacterium]
MNLAQTVGEPLVRWDWIADHTDDITEKLIEHLQLTGLAVLIGLLISLPLGIYAYRHRRLYTPITAVTGVLYTIPSLALFAFLVPYTGLSTTTAEIGLVSYTLLILIRNIVAGLDGVPADVKEAARGMGYSDRQLLWRVELPLALPVIIGGIRIALVTTIGLVTVTALIGKGGLGYFILIGIRQFFSTASILGAVLSVTLAVVADAMLLLIQRWLTPWSRGRARAT